LTSKIGQLFGSKTRVTILSKLFMNPDKSFHIRELSRQLNIPYSMLYKEEKNLTSLGILNEEKKGKITLISVNKKLPYYTELKNLIIKTAGLRDTIKTTLSNLKNIKYALIYGSFTSGEESEKSDIDLLIIGNPNEEDVLNTIAQSEKEIGREINYILWNQNELTTRIKNQHHLITDIATKPLIMLIGDEHEFRRTVKK